MLKMKRYHALQSFLRTIHAGTEPRLQPFWFYDVGRRGQTLVRRGKRFCVWRKYKRLYEDWPLYAGNAAVTKCN